MEQQVFVAMVNLFTTILFMSGGLFLLLYFLISAFKGYFYRKKISKYDLNKFEVFASNKGKPTILQSKENKNNLVYL